MNTAEDQPEVIPPLTPPEPLIEFIQRRELMINCARGGVLVVEPNGMQRTGHDLRQLLESMR